MSKNILKYLGSVTTLSKIFTFTRASQRRDLLLKYDGEVAGSCESAT
jgi:hypothetical protein